MKYCTKCGAEILEGNSFCGKCGKLLFDDEKLHTIDEVQQASPQPPAPVQPVLNTTTKSPVVFARQSKKTTRSIVGILIGAAFYILGIGHIFGVGAGIIGAIMLSVSAFSPAKTNFCPTCNELKDFEARICTHCGKPFTYGAGRAACAALVAGLLIFINFLLWTP